MRRRAILLLTAMAVVLTLVAIPAIAETKNGPIVASFSASEQIVTIDPTTGQRSAVPGAIGTEPSVTPDGKTVVYSGDADGDLENGGNRELFSAPLDGSAAPTQITQTAKAPNSLKRYPAVSPDGQKVYFQWDSFDRRGNYHIGIYSVPVSGGSPTQVVEDNVSHSGMKITPDGQYLVYAAYGEDGLGRINAVPTNGGSSHTVVDNSQSIDNYASLNELTISPDGKTVVMSGGVWSESGGSQSLYAAPFSATSTSEATKIPGTTVVAEDPDTGVTNSLLSPAFSPDGQSIAYNLWSTPFGFVTEEIRSIPATGGTPTVISPMGNGEDGSVLHSGNVWAPQAAASIVPEILTTDPADKAVDVAKTIEPKASFNTDLDSSTVNAQNVRLEMYNSTSRKWVPVKSTSSYAATSRTITVDPVDDLRSQKAYRVTLSTAIQSSTGKKLASPYTWSFTTTT